MKCYFFLPFEVFQQICKCLANKYPDVYMSVDFYTYTQQTFVPTQLLYSQTSRNYSAVVLKMCCFVSIRSSLCWALPWELFSVIFFSYVALASNNRDSDWPSGLFSLWSGTLAESHSRSGGGARLPRQHWALCSGTIRATLQRRAPTGGLFKLIKGDALLLMQARENTAVAKTPPVLQLIYIHSKAAGVSSHAEIHLMLRCSWWKRLL